MSGSRLSDRIALVTGASRGIGRAIAIAFAREGAHVVLIGRTSGALEEVDDEIRDHGGKASLIRLDLAKADRVDNLGPGLYERFGHLDVLVGNAGILGPLSPLGHVSADDWQKVMDINLNANWRLIRTLDPLLQRSAAGRAIFVTSGAAKNSAYWGPYSVSKAALEALVKTYAAEVADTAIRVNLVNPGATATAMRAKAMPGEDPATLPAPEDLAETFIALASVDCQAHGEIVDYRASR